jgi:hypothetical protein
LAIQQVYQLRETILLEEEALEQGIIVIIQVLKQKLDTGLVINGEQALR